MAKKFKLFGIFNIVDVIITLILVIALLAIILVVTGRHSRTPQVDQVIKPVEFDVMMLNQKITKAGKVFNAGDKAFITIRNVPYTKLEILRVSKNVVKTAIPDPRNRGKAIAVDDPSKPHVYDFLITLGDNAVITQDGPVIGGNKIKIGLYVTLEGADYKLKGVVTDVRIKEEEQK